MRNIKIISVLLTFFVSFSLMAQVSFTGSDINIDFSGFNGSGFSPNPNAGQLDSDDWAITGFSNGDLAFGGTEIMGSTDFTRGETNSNGFGSSGGGIYSYLSNSAILFRITSNDFTPGTISLKMVNNLGTTINTLRVEYDILIRNAGAGSNSFNLSWKIDTGNENQETSVDYTSPIGKDIAPQMVSYIHKSVVLSGMNLATTSELILKWSSDLVDSGSKDYIGIDNIRISRGDAHINNAYYIRLADALFATTGSETITLVNNNNEVDLTIPSGVTLQIANGVNYSNTSKMTNNGTIDLSPGGTFTNTGTYKGSGTFNGDFVNNGTLSPGE